MILLKKNYLKVKKNKKIKKNTLIFGNLHVNAYLKNTIISLTNIEGMVLKQWSTKSLKKTKFKKNTPYNVQLIVNQVNRFIKLKKIKKLNIYLKGAGLGRFNTVKNLNRKFIKVKYIFDKTSIPFNGCRIKKMRRL